MEVAGGVGRIGRGDDPVGAGFRRREDDARIGKTAAREIRCELIDLARHHFGPAGAGANQVEQRAPTDSSASAPGRQDPSDPSLDPQSLAWWTEFHNKIEKLPVEERVTFDLLWYHAMTQEEAAVVLNTSLATLKRRWVAARLRLQDWLGEGGNW